ncbi:MAG: HAMP domain-containing histidine kinase [Actinomycetota bacterium]|nr:HAMP domain-containing histidine kinase [Actinomycetota bacterium]
MDTRTALVALRSEQGWEVIAAVDGAGVGVLDADTDVDWGAILDRTLGADRGRQSELSLGRAPGEVVAVEAWRASLRTVVAVPVRLEDGTLVGAVAALDRDRVLVTPAHHGLLTTLADLLAHAYENHAGGGPLTRPQASEDGGPVSRHLIAEFAHDLRTPLAVIAGLAGLAQRDDGEAEQSRAAAQAIMANAKRLSAMIDGLLDAEARASGELLEQPRQIDLGGLVAEVAAETHHLLTRDEVDIAFGGAGMLVGYAHAVRRLLLNLTVNAVKYTSRGVISINAEEVEGGALLVVSDTGRGMSPREIARFERAYAKSEDSDGFGLGLTIVRRLGNVIGAEISVDSERGVGTCFRVFIPTATDREV